MLDPDEQAEYEAWRFRKLSSQPDLSVNAFNTERAAAAAAYDEGVRAAVNPGDQQKLDSLLSNSPYRRPGMTGERKTRKIAEREEDQ